MPAKRKQKVEILDLGNDDTVVLERDIESAHNLSNVADNYAGDFGISDEEVFKAQGIMSFDQHGPQQPEPVNYYNNNTNNVNVVTEEINSVNSANEVTDNYYNYQDVPIEEPVHNYYNTSSYEPQEIPQVERLEVLKKKQTMLTRINKLIEYPETCNLTMQNSVEEIEAELDRLEEQKKLKNSIKWQKRILIGASKGVEWANNKWDPLGLKLNGWSNAIAVEMDDYAEIFEEMGEKYKDSFSVAPEFKLLALVCSSALMYHISSKAAEKYAREIPEVSEVLENNPQLREQFINAAVEQTKNKIATSENNGENLTSPMSFFNQLINKQQPVEKPQQSKMKSPSMSLMNSVNISEANSIADLNEDTLSINDLGL